MKVEQALLDPAQVFSTPQDVLRETSLTTQQKIAILRQWEYDAREMQVAEDENMSGGPPDMLDKVLAALGQLDGSADPGDTAPIKQGGP